MSAEEKQALAHFETQHQDYQDIANMWKSRSGLVIAAILKRSGEDTEKIVEEGRKINIDYDKGNITVGDKENKK